MASALLEGAAGIFERGGKAATPRSPRTGFAICMPGSETEPLTRHWFEPKGEGSGQRFFGQKAQAVDREVRRRMIEPDHAELSIGAQCRLLSLSRSSFYYSPLGETDTNLALMRLIDKQFLDTPFYGVRQMTWHLRSWRNRAPVGPRKSENGHLVNEKRIRRLTPASPRRGTGPYPYLLRGLQVVRPGQV
jgi:hypothetical protein